MILTRRSTACCQREKMSASLYTANAKCRECHRITARSGPRESVLAPGSIALTSSKSCLLRVCSIRVGPGVVVDGSAATLDKFRSDSKQLSNPAGLDCVVPVCLWLTRRKHRGSRANPIPSAPAGSAPQIDNKYALGRLVAPSLTAKQRSPRPHMKVTAHPAACPGVEAREGS